MTEYKLVPLEPTPEMIEAAEDAYMPFGDMDLAIRMAVLTAPAVQGEPVAWLAGEVCGGDASHNTVNVALDNPAPWGALTMGARVAIRPLQPAEQQPAPDVAGLVEALEEIATHPDKPTSNSFKRAYASVLFCARQALAAHRKQGGG